MFVVSPGNHKPHRNERSVGTGRVVLVPTVVLKGPALFRVLKAGQQSLVPHVVADTK
jgi:hypothetical protein